MTTLPTPELRAEESRRRKEQRWRRDAERHIRTMRIRGCTLQLTHGHGRGPLWCLSNGEHVEHGAAEIMLRNSHIASVGDALLEGVRCQTYRFVE